MPIWYPKQISNYLCKKFKNRNMRPTLKFFFITVISIISIACSKTEDISMNQLSGKWNLTNVSSKVELKDQSIDDSNKDVSSEQIYFEFDANGNYTTNAEISLVDNSLKKSASNSSNTYKISGDNFILTYTDAQLKQELTLYLNIVSLTTNQLELNISKTELLKSFEQSVTKLDPFTTALVNLYLDSILKFDFTLGFIKQ